LLSLSLILEMAMAHIALKGTMWNVAPREFMSTSSTFVYVRCSASCLRLLRNVDG